MTKLENIQNRNYNYNEEKRNMMSIMTMKIYF